MDLQNIKVNILAKANYGVELMYPQAKACVDSKACGGSMNWNVALAHSINKILKCVYKMVKEDILDTYGAKTDRVYALAKKKN
jgi:hypothetical protein